MSVHDENLNLLARYPQKLLELRTHKAKMLLGYG